MEQGKKTRFVKGAAILAAASLISKVLGVLFRVFAIRILGEEGMFFYEKVYPIYSWLLIISSSGIPIAISRMVASRMARGAFDEAERVFQKARRMLALLGLATTAIMFFGASPIARLVLGSEQAGMRWSLMALAPALFFTSILCAYRGYLQGLERMSGTGLSQLAEQIFKILFGLTISAMLFARFTGTPYATAAGSVGILLGVASSEALALLVIYPIYRKERACKLPWGFVPSRQTGGDRILRDLFAIAIPITLGASILPIANVLDSAMITRLLVAAGISAEEADRLYVILCTYVRSIINLPAGISTSNSMAVVPAIAAAITRKEPQNVKSLSALSVKLALAIGLPCAVGLSVLARPVIFLIFGSILPHSLDVAESLMHVAAFTVVFISLSQSATGALQGIGKQRLPVYFLLIGGATKVLVNWICIRIPSVNILGGVLSNLACYGIAAILDTVALVRCSGARLPFAKTFLKPVLASALMGGLAYAVYYGVGHFVDLSRYAYSAAACLLAVLVAIAAYAALVLALRIFSVEELAYIPGGRKLLRRFKKDGTP